MRVDSGGEDREEGRGMRGERRDEDGREDERERSERERASLHPLTYSDDGIVTSQPVSDLT